MGILASDGLSVSVGDGGSPELFNVLRGAQVTKFDLLQKRVDSDAIATDAWDTGAGIVSRYVSVTFDALMTDEAAPNRVRAVAVNGAANHFQLMLSPTETLSFSGYVTNYRETIQAGSPKKLSCTLESSGAVTIA